MGWRIRSLGASAVVAFALAAPARADAPPEAATGKIDKKIAVWRFDALGIDPEIVQRLETLFRSELDRLDRQPLPTPRAIDRTITDPKERDCTGEDKCLASIGKRLGVDLVVTGTIGQLGDNYVLTVKAVDVASVKSQSMATPPLRGSPDDLIENVRVLAYRLLAPDQLHGAVQVESDLVGAEVRLDAKVVGKTPLPDRGVIRNLALGKHKLRVTAAGYDPIEQDVEIHFQKVSPMLVHLLPSEVVGTGRIVREVHDPVYARPWFIGGAAVIAIGTAIAIGLAAAPTRHCYVAGTGAMTSCP